MENGFLAAAVTAAAPLEPFAPAATLLLGMN